MAVMEDDLRKVTLLEEGFEGSTWVGKGDFALDVREP